MEIHPITKVMGFLSLHQVKNPLPAVVEPIFGGLAKRYDKLAGVTTLLLIIVLPTSVLEATTVPLILVALIFVKVPGLDIYIYN